MLWKWCRRSRLDSWVGEDPLEEEMETYSSIIAQSETQIENHC